MSSVPGGPASHDRPTSVPVYDLVRVHLPTPSAVIGDAAWDGAGPVFSASSSAPVRWGRW
ncbi:hypothetical protein LO762_25375 [Actinocorallia sp. API 0066]|uniref:hypothetical protein n=1 Tax=Actinocorallia sp. API 0066 TaxID=2896846 RepID=UPI001E3A27AE|nr:hypothetical protein [Actinocorallia sp. API 0066]MCD0452490.1 hypothetical protein [Actinocorallia sp. API 0066]